MCLFAKGFVRRFRVFTPQNERTGGRVLGGGIDGRVPHVLSGPARLRGAPRVLHRPACFRAAPAGVEKPIGRAASGVLSVRRAASKLRRWVNTQQKREKQAARLTSQPGNHSQPRGPYRCVRRPFQPFELGVCALSSHMRLDR